MVAGREELLPRSSSLPPPPRCFFHRCIAGGVGAHLQELTTSGRCSQEDRHLHINLREMKSALMALLIAQGRLMIHLVVLMSDNTTVVA